MAAAVRRARRENAGGAHRLRNASNGGPRHYVREEEPDEGWSDPDYALGSGTPLWSDDDPTWRGQRRTPPSHHHRSHATTRLAIAAGAVLAVLVAIAAVAYWPSGSPSTAVLDRTHARVPKATSPPRTTAPTSRPRSTTPPTSAAPTTAAPAPSTSNPTTTTIPPSGLHISSLIPARGGPGQLVMVRGANLFSPDGEVVVRFDGQSAPTNCATQTICTATVPDLGASGTVQVTVTTQSGTSNVLDFAYSK